MCTSCVSYKSAHKNHNDVNITMDVYGAILAGGSGRRLWPLSRKHLPKQFITLVDNKTLLATTIERILPLVNPEKLSIVTTQEHEQAALSVVGHAPYRILLEPCARNTAAALLFTVMHIYKENPEAIIFFVPSDHYIKDEQAFIVTLTYALRAAQQHNLLILLGIQPTSASNNYGYIQRGAQLQDQIYNVVNFHEKPSSALAHDYIKQDSMLCNSGIVCAKACVFLEQFSQHAPNLVQAMENYFQGKVTYDMIPLYSFDKAILEKTNACAVALACFSWSDVGSLEQFIAARQDTLESESIKKHKILAYNSHNTIVDAPDKLVVLVDVDDLCIIETDDILFIRRRSKTNSLTDIAEYVKKSGYEQYV